MLVVSPFARGGLVCSDTFDHTSTLRFLESRFGVEVPNLSQWRRSVTGDLTSAFNFAAKPKVGHPGLPVPNAADAKCTGVAARPGSEAAVPRAGEGDAPQAERDRP